VRSTQSTSIRGIHPTCTSAKQNVEVRLTVPLKLLPSAAQSAALGQTLEQTNAEANHISATAWRERTFSQYRLHHLVYHDTRARTGLRAQVVVRLIAKVADAYKLDHTRPRRFRPEGGFAYDERILRYGAEHVSIWTVAGRQTIPFVCGPRQRALLQGRKGESDLVSRGGRWYLLATVEVPEPPMTEVPDYLGVDLGIVNIAADSDGTLYAGAHLNGLRHRHRRLRQRLQRKGTRSAKRLLKRRRRTERRFATHVNHTLSKHIVAEAQGTGRGIALEDLRGIRERVSVSRPQRATLHGWAFHQLRRCIAYKAAWAGVPVVYVDPRHTSRTCPACGLVDARNRPSQARFQCVCCGLAGPADTIAAQNIRVRGRGASKSSVRRGSGIVCVEASSGKSRLLWVAVHTYGK
jgi:IS605 OrfB family transposase